MCEIYSKKYQKLALNKNKLNFTHCFLQCGSHINIKNVEFINICLYEQCQNNVLSIILLFNDLPLDNIVVISKCPTL